MEALLAQIARRLALIRGAIRTGLVEVASAGLGEGLLDLAEQLLATAREAVGAGLLGYGLFVGRTPV